jgi:hypothetical protein
MHRPEHVSAWSDWWFDGYKFIVYELFLYTIAVLVKRKQFEIAAALLKRSYYVVIGDSGTKEFCSFCAFQNPVGVLDDVRGRRLNRTSGTADLLKERADSGLVSFEDVMQADFVLFLRSLVASQQGRSGIWFPSSAVYAGHGRAFPVFAKAESAHYFEVVKILLGVSGKDELMQKYASVNEALQFNGIIRFRNAYSRISIPALGNFDKLNTLP